MSKGKNSFKCPSCGGQLTTTHVLLKEDNVQTRRHRCQDCKKVFTSRAVILCEVKRNGQGHIAQE